MSMDFIEKKARELYRSNSGLSKPADQFGVGFPLLSYSDIFHNFIVPDNLITLVNSTENERANCSIKRGDVFLTRTSETTEELGMSCVALKDIPGATFNGFAKRLRPITDEIVPEYAAYYFRSNYFRAQCMSMASLITRASLNDGMIGRLTIRYPKKKSDQEKIGGILLHYDDLISNNIKRVKSLEQIVENIYKEWFVRFRFPGYKGIEFENGVPKEWKKRKLREIAVEVDRPERAENRCNYDHYLPIDKIPAKSMVLQEEDSIENAESSLISFKKGDVLFGAMRSYLHKVIIAPFDGLTRSTCFVINSIEPEYKLFVYLLLYQKSSVDFATTVSVGSTMPYARWKDFSRMNIVVPNREIVKQFNMAVEPIMRRIQYFYDMNQKLIKQRDLLLPRLMSGKLEV